MARTSNQDEAGPSNPGTAADIFSANLWVITNFSPTDSEPISRGHATQIPVTRMRYPITPTHKQSPTAGPAAINAGPIIPTWAADSPTSSRPSRSLARASNINVPVAGQRPAALSRGDVFSPSYTHKSECQGTTTDSYAGPDCRPWCLMHPHNNAHTTNQCPFPTSLDHSGGRCGTGRYGMGRSPDRVPTMVHAMTAAVAMPFSRQPVASAFATSCGQAAALNYMGPPPTYEQVLTSYDIYNASYSKQGIFKPKGPNHHSHDSTAQAMTGQRRRSIERQDSFNSLDLDLSDLLNGGKEPHPHLIHGRNKQRPKFSNSANARKFTGWGRQGNKGKPYLSSLLHAEVYDHDVAIEQAVWEGSRRGAGELMEQNSEPDPDADRHGSRSPILRSQFKNNPSTSKIFTRRAQSIIMYSKPARRPTAPPWSPIPYLPEPCNPHTGGDLSMQTSTWGSGAVAEEQAPSMTWSEVANLQELVTLCTAPQYETDAPLLQFESVDMTAPADTTAAATVTASAAAIVTTAVIFPASDDASAAVVTRADEFPVTRAAVSLARGVSSFVNIVPSLDPASAVATVEFVRTVIGNFEAYTENISTHAEILVRYASRGTPAVVAASNTISLLANSMNAIMADMATSIEGALSLINGANIAGPSSVNN